MQVIVVDKEDDHEAIPDEPDFGSMGESADWHQAVMEAEGNRPDYVINLSLIGIEEPNACDGSVFTQEVALRTSDLYRTFR